jgi:surfeit locus 1 family protein
MKNPTWFQVAKRPRWILGLVVSLIIAAVFAALGQWQLERSFEEIREQDPLAEEVFELTSIATPAMPMTAEAAYKLASAEIYLDLGNVYIIANRVQETESGVERGYWLVTNSFALLEDSDSTASLTVAVGYAANLDLAEAAREELRQSIQVEAFISRTGRYIQTEAPTSLPDEGRPYLFNSLSLAQLVNLYSAEPVSSFAGILVLNESLEETLAPIQFKAPTPGLQINWLTLFYALEWALFAGFAIFLWWRLVEDQRVRESSESDQ